ncbi:hypothetical protein D3C80_1927360 [compost metagenome]
MGLCVPARQADDTQPGQRGVQQHLRPAGDQAAVQLQGFGFAVPAQRPFYAAAVGRIAVQQAVMPQQIVRILRRAVLCQITG